MSLGPAHRAEIGFSWTYTSCHRDETSNDIPSMGLQLLMSLLTKLLRPLIPSVYEGNRVLHNLTSTVFTIEVLGDAGPRFCFLKCSNKSIASYCTTITSSGNGLMQRLVSRGLPSSRLTISVPAALVFTSHRCNVNTTIEYHTTNLASYFQI